MTLDFEYRLGDWIVKPHTNTVTGPSGEVHVEPKAMQVLSLLAHRAGQVVTKQEILTDVWEGTFVSEEVLPNAIWELRKALGDDAKKPRFIQTLPKKGYRLIAPVGSTELAPPLEDASRPSKRRLFDSWGKWLPAAAIAVVVASGIVFSPTRGGDAPVATGDRDYAVAVLGFENHTSSPDLAWLTTGVPTMLRTGLAEVPGVRVVSDEKLRPAGEGSGERRAAAHRAGVSAIVAGSIFKNGSEYRIEVQVENGEDARIVAAHSARGEDVFPLMDELTAWVRDTVSAKGGVPRTPIVPLREMTTESLDAFRRYTEGAEARKHLRIRDARRLLVEAVQIDPGFALAYFELQEVAMWQKDDAGYQEFRQKTLENQDRLPPQKRMLLEAGEIWRKQDPKSAEKILKEIIERNPEEEDAYLQLSHLCRADYRPGESLAILERGIAALPHSGYLRLYYGYGLLWQGRFPEAIHQFEVYSRINPEEANPWDSMGEAYLIAGIPERALEKYAHALEVDPEFSSSHVGRAWAFGQLGRFRDALTEIDSLPGGLPPHFTAEELAFFRAYLLSRGGRYREAEALIARLTEQPSPVVSIASRQFQALLQIERGRTKEALRTIESLLALSAPAPEAAQEGSGSRQLAALTKLLGGVAAARSGDLSAAQRFLAELGELYEANDPRESWWYYLLLGELALASGDARAAHAAFTQGEPRHKLMFNVTKPVDSLGGGLIFRDGPARSLAAGGDRRSAIQRYRDLLRPDIGHKWTALLEPRFHLELARLERAENHRVEASKHYRDFLQLWSEADADLPEVEEARSYLASAS